MKNISKIVLLTLLVLSQSSYSQQEETPKLIVGVVIDQMRAEYLYRFQDNYTENGFKRLIKEGFNVKNTHYNYIPTATGPGHTSIYTGTTPANHGIMGNSWYSRALKREVYCAEDSTVYLVDNNGIDKGVTYKNYSRSPKNVMATTITDELKLFTNGRSKVIGLSIKDRASIFPAGHMADAAYWYNSNNGNFITSSYYKNDLPKWLKEFNNQKRADSLLNLVWKPLLPINKYKNSGEDNASFEKIHKGRKNSTLPYKLNELRKANGDFAFLAEVPYGNTLLTQLALTTLKGEHLGKGDDVDFLAISYSSTDYIGHNYGVRSKEIEDTYVRMDREIATLLNGLDKELGKGNYTLFLTSDHACSDHPPFLNAMRLPGKFYNPKSIGEDLNSHLSKIYGEANYVLNIDKLQVYLADTTIDKEALVKETQKFLKTVEGVKETFAPEFTVLNLNNSVIGAIIRNSYHSKESGDVIFHFQPGWMLDRNYGASHGHCYTSDTHVPLLWYGMNIPKGESVKPYTITQIAPTLSMLLNIPFPNSSNTRPIEILFK